MRILIATFILLISSTQVFANAPEEISRNLREKAQLLFEQDKARAARVTLGQAVYHAEEIAEPYTRVNELRYIAHALKTIGEPGRAKKVYERAYAQAMDVMPVPRKVSAIIAVLELQKADGGERETRRHILKAIRSGLLHDINRTGKPGEIGRLIRIMDNLLDQDEKREVKEQIESLTDDDVRRKAQHAFSELQFILPEGGSAEQTETEQGDKPGSEPKPSTPQSVAPQEKGPEEPSDPE